MSTNSKMKENVSDFEQDAKHVAQDAATSPFVEGLTRLGYLARGIVYGVIGFLALQVVLGRGGALTDTQGAIATLGNTQLGGILLYVILVGLVSYGLWGLIRAVVDVQRKGTHLKGIAMRIGFTISGISYLLLGLATYNIIQGGSSNGSQSSLLQQATGTILSKPGGDTIIVVVAFIIMGAGFLQVFQGLQYGFDRQFKPYALTQNQRKWIIRLGQFGTVVRGLIFTMIGLFLFLAAYHQDPSLAKGIDGVLAALLTQAYGPWLLGIVALGLIAFGIYSAMSGLWLRLKR